MACGDRLHYKFVVMDNKTVITRSFNWSPSSAYTNDETLLVIDSPKLAAHFARKMNRIRGGDESREERVSCGVKQSRENCC